MKLSGLIIETSSVHSTKSARPLSIVKFLFLCDNGWKQGGLDEGRYIEGVREGVMNSVYDHQFPHRPVSHHNRSQLQTLEAAAA